MNFIVDSLIIEANLIIIKKNSERIFNVKICDETKPCKI